MTKSTAGRLLLNTAATCGASASRQARAVKGAFAKGGAQEAGRACSRTPRSALTKRRCVAAAGTWRFSASTAPWLPRDRLSYARRKRRGQPHPLLYRRVARPAAAQPARASLQRRRTTLDTVWPSESSRSVA